MAVGDVYRITNKYTWVGPAADPGAVECTNVYFYRQTFGSVAAAMDVGVAFGQDFLPSMLAIAPTNISFTGFDCVNMMTIGDAYSESFGGAGSRVIAANTQLSPEANLSLYAPRPYPGTRDARKRYPFLAKADVEGRVVLAALRGGALGVAFEAAHESAIAFGSSGAQIVVFRPTGAVGDGGVIVWTPTTWSYDSRMGSQDTRRN